MQIQLKQGDSLNPEMPAMLGCAYGFWGGVHEPVALAEYRSQAGRKERALFEASLSGIE